MAQQSHHYDVVDFSTQLDRQWFNYFERASRGAFSGNRNHQRNFRESSNALHGYQTFSTPVRCGLLVRNQGAKNAFVDYSDSAVLTFAIKGGAEIPHFLLTLRLRSPNAKSREDVSKDLYLRVIWTAFGAKGFDMDREVTSRGGDVDHEATYTFSDRLMNVNFKPVVLDDKRAKASGGKQGTNAYHLWWKHYQPPYCYGFSVPEAVLEPFSDSQKSAARTFLKIRHPSTEVELMTRERGDLLFHWKFFTGMPIPTPGPYPLYDCRFVNGTGSFAQIKQIPSLENGDIVAHHKLRQRQWMNYPPSFAEGSRFMPMTTSAPLQFINEREYEVMKTVGMLRDVGHQLELYRNVYNRVYTFNLIPAPATDDIFFALLDTSTRALGHQNPEHQERCPLPSAGTPVTITMRPHTHGSVGGLTKAGSAATTTPKEEWRGYVVTPGAELDISEAVIVVRVKRIDPSASAGLILEKTGYAKFGNENPPSRQGLRSIRMAMQGNHDLGIPENNVLKRIILAHDNEFVKHLPDEGDVTQAARSTVDHQKKRLNEAQVNALKSAFTTGKLLKHLMTIVEGPPGTGKTLVSAFVATHHCQLNQKVLVVCGSNHGLDAAATRICAVMSTWTPSVVKTDGVYRLETEYAEEHDALSTPSFGHESLENSGLVDMDSLNDIQGLGVTPDIMESLKTYVDGRCKLGNKLSLGQHILSRIQKAINEGSGWISANDDEKMEHELLWLFLTWRKALQHLSRLFVEPIYIWQGEEALNTLEDDQLSHGQKLARGFERAWTSLQQFYITRAKLIFCTASTAGRKTLRYFKPEVVIVEEASQMTESICLNSICRYYGSLKKVVLSGDSNQLPPTVVSLGRNECYDSEKLSLMERLVKTGYPSIRLSVQHRMHPDIAEFVSHKFYEDRLENHQSCSGRPAAKEFAKVMSQIAPSCAKGNSYFVSVKDSALFCQKGGHSMFNSEYIVCIDGLVKKFLDAGCPQGHITILSYYSEERRIMSRVLHQVRGFKDVVVQSVDSAQGSENSIVMVSTTRPGGGNLALGSLRTSGVNVSP